MSSSKRFEESKMFEEGGGATVSRRALVGVAGATAATLVASRAFAQQPQIFSAAQAPHLFNSL